MTIKKLIHVSTAVCIALATPALAQPASPPAATSASIEKAIDIPAMPVKIKKWMGQDRTFSIFPNRIFVAGYNIGAIRKVVAVGKARGGLLGGPSATSKSELYADGIDEALLIRIANAAYGDLVFQLKAAGYEVVSLETARAAAGADKLKFDTPAYSATAEEVLVVGPTATGVRGNTPLAKIEFGSMGTPVMATTLETMVVMPNLAFDFAWAAGNRTLGFTATSQTGLRFGINPNHTRNRIFATKRTQFLEGDFIYSPDGEATSDAQFATIGDTERTDNRGMRVANALLGLNVMARSKQTGFAQIDQAAYERLALSAAKGWNAAFVADLRARTGK
jgi:hypothetical protein